MANDLTDEQLQAEITRGDALDRICLNHGFPQAATQHRQTAMACERELQSRLHKT